MCSKFCFKGNKRVVGIIHEYFEKELHFVHVKAMCDSAQKPRLCDERRPELWKTLIISICSLSVAISVYCDTNRHGLVSKTLLKRVQVSLMCAQLW